MKNIIIGGDFVPTASNSKYFEEKNMKNLIGKELYNLIKTSDFKIFNLEAPLTNSKKCIKKEGPNIKCSPKTLNGFSELEIDMFTLANNHILDYGEEGLIECIKLLEEENIKYVGAGENVIQASKGIIINIDGKKIGIYACSEHEYTIAGIDSYGANPFDPLESLDHITELKKKSDYVIVLYHGGKEYYQYPTPNIQKRCKKMVEKGANLILCQHSHCIGCREKYLDGEIVYGQGNFLFDRDDKINYIYKQTGLLVKLNINDDINLEYIPIRKNKEKIQIAKKEDRDKILKEFEKRSNEIQKKNFVTENYKNAAIIQGGRYLIRLSKFGLILNAIDNRFFKGKILSRKLKVLTLKQRQTIENMLQCEVHNELVLEYLKNINKW